MTMASSSTPGRTVALIDSLDPVEYDADRDCFSASFNADRDSTCLAVISLVATADGKDPVDMPPLEAAIDTAALEKLFANAPDGGQRFGSASFRYGEFDVTVHSDGRVEAAHTDSEGLES